MSRRDGIGEVDGYCHECGAGLPEPYTGETDLCYGCASRGNDPDPETVDKARRYWRLRDIEDASEMYDDDTCPLCHAVHCTDADDDWCTEQTERDELDL